MLAEKRSLRRLLLKFYVFLRKMKTLFVFIVFIRIHIFYTFTLREKDREELRISWPQRRKMMVTSTKKIRKMNFFDVLRSARNEFLLIDFIRISYDVHILQI